MCKRFQFCACTGQCLLKDAKQNFQKKPVNTLVFKLRSCSFKFDLVGWRHLNQISFCLCHKNLGLDQKNIHQ